MKSPYFGVSYIALDNLPDFAKNTAAALSRGDDTSTIYSVRKFSKNLEFIASSRRRAALFAKDHTYIPQEYEWLLDNWYIAEREAKCAFSDFKSLRALPALSSDSRRPLVLEASRALAASGLFEVTPERISLFLSAFQEHLRLSQHELAAFLPALRLELVAALADACRLFENPENSTELSQRFAAIFSSLRFLQNFDALPLLESVNLVEQTLRLDPVYAAMDGDSRLSYRHELSRLARLNGVDELDAAKYVIELCAPGEHVGHYIFTKPFGSTKKQPSGNFYIGFIILSTLFFSLLLGFALSNLFVSALLLFPVSELIKNIADFLALRFFTHSRRIPRLDLSEGVPPDGKTLCAVSILLSSAAAGQNAAELLEEFKISNREAGDDNLLFALLADLPESDKEELPSDCAVLESTALVIESLNDKYGGGFFLLFRKRTKNERDGVYLGWERKRGAIVELCRFLRGIGSGIICTDNRDKLRGVNFIIALDSDTRLSAGTACELIGAALHPLNRPVIDFTRGIVTAGHGIIQPRVSVNLSAASASDFTLLFAGQGGADPYGGAASDLYQNMFGTGSFTGKGIIDIDSFLACLDTRFPENRVLSHDLLEGAFLRCAFAGDIELSDGFPSNVKSFYSRLHRWTRGDWQSIPWLFSRTENAKGVKIPNPLPQTDRWKIADNLRRSLVSPFLLTALIAGMLRGTRAFIITLIAAFAVLFLDLFISGAVSLFSPGRSRVRYISSIITGFGGKLTHTFIKLMLLPFDAFVCLSAVFTALFRMCFSKKRLLEWTTAADSERRKGNSLFSYYLYMWPCLAACLIVFFLSPFIPARAAALVWVLTPLCAFSLGKPKKPRREISPQSRLFLARCAGDHWRYFEEFLTPEDNFLPPDNFQEQPSAGIAHRTSPTNIGLALISALAAIDLGACSRETALTLIENMLNTITKLPKWQGLLYNWYDTTNLTVLNPPYVSAVDCGNFAACLIALHAGLLEYDMPELADTVENLLSQMSFAPLFDEKRMLFYIGWDVSQNAPSDSRYDLLASEAMLTSYIAISRGDVPRKHWRKLGRSLVSFNGYRGMASWTGTMFEYLMPSLLLPCFRDCLIFESLKFCVYVQKKQSDAKKPWGMSESAFYDFDHTLSYRYKAHGVSDLALKRGMSRDFVISPYSSFLALSTDLKAAVSNLRRLQRLGAEGRFGFFEALDFTPSRVRQKDRDFETVKTYMAHHIGMSIVAIDNALNSGIMQKRFLKNRVMSSFTELLQEKVPVGALVLQKSPRDVPDKPPRAFSPLWSYCSDDAARDFRSCLIGNGSYTVTISQTGQSRSVWNGVTLTRSSFEPFGLDTGISFFLSFGDGELVSLLPAPAFDQSTRYGALMSGGICKISAHNGVFSSVCSVTVPENDAGELRTVELTSHSHLEAELICCFEPVLSRLSDYDSHPAFSKLSLETSFSDGIITISRRPRVKSHRLCLAFGCDHDYSFDTSRETALGRGGILSLRRALSKPAQSSQGAVLDPFVISRVKLKLEPDTPAVIKFALAPSSDSRGASGAVLRILDDSGKSAASHLDLCAHRLGLSPELTETAMLLLSDIIYPSPMRRIGDPLKDALIKGQRAMWSFAVSGDFPILSAVITSEDSLPNAADLIKIHALLTENGVFFDLVFLLRDGGDYRGALKGGICDILRSFGFEHKHGARCGVHTAEFSDDNADIILAASFLVLNPGENIADLAKNENNRAAFTPPLPTVFYEPSVQNGDNILKSGYNDDNSFYFDVLDNLPPNAWSHILTNGSFGFLASDSGTGHMWHVNARENKINRWLNDSLATLGTERLFLITDNGDKISLFAAPDGCPCRVTYGFGFARWEKTIGSYKTAVTAFVPPDVPCRVFLVETDAPDSFDIAYFTDLVLGSSEPESVYTETFRHNGVLSAKNSYSADFQDTVFSLTASVPAKFFTCSKADYVSGGHSGICGAGFVPCFAAVYPASNALAIVTGCADFDTLTELSDIGTVRLRLRETYDYWQELTSRFTVKTPCEDLNRYLNGWALYQTLACRVLGRTSLYQSGGAYGFRDQLQDVCALILTNPDFARGQIIRAAEHQYLEGDVQHWWHPGTSSGAFGDKGVRTKCSDDLLWLPYALCEYCEKTGQLSLCDEPAGFIASAPLLEDESERYEQPHRSEISGSIFDHAMRALNLVLLRGTGSHGLCLIGGGDWNDGMNLVGAGGLGESVWLTWFVIHTARRFAALCQKRGDSVSAERYLTAAESLHNAAENAWDGDWYLRGYFDDATPLGSAVSDECRIDSIAQSFAALAGASREKTKKALESAVKILFDRDLRIIKLFDPPFSSGRTSPGYIKGYSPGFRENGGQYTHGAIWLSMALFISGMTEEGFEALCALLPQGRVNSVYRTEPYVLAADVYSNTQHLGRGGWTWYTGASGWFLRVAAENLLGLKLENNSLSVKPNLPKDWDGFEATVKIENSVFDITADSDGSVKILKDGAP